MLEVQLSKRNSQKTIVTLNANVIEYFWATKHDGGRSMHVGHIQSIGITTTKGGKHALVITTPYLPFLNDEVDAEAVDQVNTWIAAVQGAMQTLRV